MPKVKMQHKAKDGMCSTCASLLTLVTDMGEIYACNSYKISGDGCPVRIRHKVIECSAYTNKNNLPLAEMKKQAWYLSTDEKRHVGFRPWSALKGDEKKDLRRELYARPEEWGEEYELPSKEE